MDQVKQFFAENPTATVCFVALGMVKATLEEAQALLGGVKGQQVLTYEREAGVVYGKESEKLLTVLISCEEEEAKAHSTYEAEKTDAAMQAFKKAQQNTKDADAAYQAQLKAEAKQATVKEAEKTDGETGDTTDHVVTAEDLEKYPELVENGVQVGDTIQLPVPPLTPETE